MGAAKKMQPASRPAREAPKRPQSKASSTCLPSYQPVKGQRRLLVHPSRDAHRPRPHRMHTQRCSAFLASIPSSSPGAAVARERASKWHLARKVQSIERTVQDRTGGPSEKEVPGHAQGSRGSGLLMIGATPFRIPRFLSFPVGDLISRAALTSLLLPRRVGPRPGRMKDRRPRGRSSAAG